MKRFLLPAKPSTKPDPQKRKALVIPGDVPSLLQLETIPSLLFSFPPPKLWEQVAAVNRRDPPPEVVAAEDHRIHVLCNILQPQRVLDR